MVNVNSVQVDFLKNYGIFINKECKTVVLRGMYTSNFNMDILLFLYIFFFMQKKILFILIEWQRLVIVNQLLKVVNFCADQSS